MSLAQSDLKKWEKTTSKRKPVTIKTIKWENIWSLVLVSILVVVLCIWYLNLGNYQISYVKYQMQEKDSLFNVVQDMNTYVPSGWDTRDFVQLTLDKNHISDVTKIHEGEVILIPIAKPKE